MRYGAMAGVALAWMALAGAAPSGDYANYANPVLFADYSDPDVIRVGRDYYLVSSSFHLSPGIPVLHSRDLVHWRIIGHVLPRLPFAPEYDMPGPHTLTDRISKPVGGTRYAGGVWAPSIRHHAGKYYVYWATPDEGVFMASATNPAGPWSAPVHVIAQKGLEDPCPFWDDDGSAWLVHSRVGAGPLILHRMRPDGTGVLDAGKVIVEDKTALPVLEGPKLYKRDGWYQIWAPIGGVETGSQVVLRSRSIEGPYDHRVVLEPGNTNVQGPHQGGWVETPDGKGWFVHFNSTGAFGRITHLQPVAWGPDGWPVIGNPIPGRTSGQPVAGHRLPVAGQPRWTPQTSDGFDTPRLGLQWQWNHNPDDRRWSLTQRPGWLRLTAGHAEHLVGARGTLTQMLTGPAMRTTVRIDPHAMRDGQRAGLTLFGVRPSWIGLVKDGGLTRITLAIEGVETPGVVVPARPLLLRAAVGSDQQVRYAYSIDGRRFTALGGAIPLARFSWWRGSRPGLFTFTRDAQATGGSVDIDWVRVDPTEALGSSG
ncbi:MULTISPECIES: glycoside hydrolase 43 family protein [unclassified Sphingomonas]|uniref:glycoside hydrolase family 43 protein n=1 Tax=unclassified Sphingomonas TaxID=196159 RepID=UPI0009EB4CA8|nr:MULTISPECIES: glycoside hydrolase 43 family protein [unclassified Sphingomonas]